MSGVNGGEKRVVLRTEGLTKRYGGVHALEDADFELYEGEHVAVVGDNGAGKSTLIKLLLGLLGTPLLAVLAPGFSSDQRELAVGLLHVMVLTIPLTACAEVLRAWLNARHMFVVPAAYLLLRRRSVSQAVALR